MAASKGSRNHFISEKY